MGEDQKKGKDDRKNRDFVQMYRPFMDEIAELGASNSTALKLFMFIGKHMDNNNALCVSMKSLQELLGYSRQTLSKAVKYLKDKGWLCVLKSGTTNIYILNPDIVWTSYDNQKAYCKFQTNVIVTPSENAEYLKNVNSSFKYKHINDEFIDTVRDKRVEREAFIQSIENESVENEEVFYEYNCEFDGSTASERDGACETVWSDGGRVPAATDRS